MHCNQRNALKRLYRILTISLFACTSVHARDLKEVFSNPSDAARPGVYWYFMDGNMNREEMVADLEAMHAVGIGSVLFLEVGIGVPVGPVPFMSDAWQDNLVHAIQTCDRLGMEFILGTGPGWSQRGEEMLRALSPESG